MTVQSTSDIIAKRDAELRGVAAKFAAAGRPFDIMAYGRECDRVHAFYADMLPKAPRTVLSAGAYDPVFDNTTVAARYWGRI